MSEVVAVEQSIIVAGTPSLAKVWELENKTMDDLVLNETISEIQIGEQTRFTLMANGDEDDMYLEVVRFDKVQVNSEEIFAEQEFSDPIYEIPRDAEEAISILTDFAEQSLIPQLG